MKLYNTLTRTIEEFKPRNSNKVMLYTCGPTVYHYAHIGNLRCYIMEDVLEKSLNYIGYEVERVMNITDVGHLTNDSDDGDDKMVKGAIREHKTVMEIAQYYSDCFFEDCEELNIKRPQTVIPATSCINLYIDMISKLLKDGYAYKSGENVYFDTSKLDNYYVLTNHKEDDLIIGARNDVTEDKNKKNKTDFVLWFTKSKFQDQELKWDSPWGLGYPGWHIECSCISLKYLGEYLDIHCGGVDNIFPHHTNEIAQTESYLGHKWCSHWFHIEHLNDSNGKMSKSTGEFLRLNLLKSKGYNPLAYRLMCLNSHYRKQLVFSYDLLDSCQNTYNKLISKINQIKDNVKDDEMQENYIDEYTNNYKDAINSDLNTSMMITILYDVIKNEKINNKTKLFLISEFDKVLSLDLLTDKKIESDKLEYINGMINKRKMAKMNKDYELADNIRMELEKNNIFIKDTRDGTIFEIR